MENTKLIFTGDLYSEDKELQLYHTDFNKIFVKIYNQQTPDKVEYITLNKATAVKLSKVLKREISKIQD